MRNESRGESRGDNRGFGMQQKFKAVCSDCGQDCEVPFQPKEGRPVYCRNCYQNHKKQ